MDKTLQTLQHNLEIAVQRADADGIEFWFARDLQTHLGYTRWENFQIAIKRAMESCEANKHKAFDHFRGATKMIELAVLISAKLMILCSPVMPVKGNKT